MKNFNRGFTLIELLVVIGIIGILSAVIVPNFMGARERSRDLRRKSDIRQIQKAMEMYKDDQTPPAYPLKAVFDAITCGDAWTIVSTTYMSQFPCDPTFKDNAGNYVHYTYAYDPTVDTLKYTLYACLENLSDSDGDGACSWVGSTSAQAGIKYNITQP